MEMTLILKCFEKLCKSMDDRYGSDEPYTTDHFSNI
ncbi:hypothetical protein AYI69_g5395, partial [Smittium culicis]